MGEDDHRPPSLQKLGDKVRAARAKHDDRTGKQRRSLAGDADKSALSLAFRIGVELVAALAVAVLIGLTLDRWLDTMPLFLILFFGFGAVAGVLNVYRAVSGIGYDPTYRRAWSERETAQKQDGDGDSDHSSGSA